jgi:hypothetical protein
VLLDNRIQSDAAQVSTDYMDLVSLGLRQVMASTELTISQAHNGEWNTTDAQMFMKDTGQSTSAPNSTHPSIVAEFDCVEEQMQSIPFMLRFLQYYILIRHGVHGYYPLYSSSRVVASYMPHLI